MNNNVKNNILCGIFAALIAVGAFIKIPIPICPFTLQFLFTNLAGLLLGKKVGSRAVGIYIILGLIGLPIFSEGGGIGYFIHPTFGYILGFYAGTYVAGHIVHKNNNFSFKNILYASFCNLAIVYMFGMIYYYAIGNYFINSPIGLYTLILYCFILAVPGDILLCLISTCVAKKVIPVINNSIQSTEENSKFISKNI
ncbi:biotin transporter BioY [Clostridium butyricum]|uniref:Biotin transporter n=1 Tax=Clostridium butyricum TaxID=1492 RepID=A0A2S7F897_CLOBU|nr:biotin transporter BioY [Clostridium butyricum]KHD14909.1 biotin biosynthesis protein BioY [Clostridium butyricum]PPV13388.1 biotin biosynthesis protein BioY [Clostridium butyricum]